MYSLASSALPAAAALRSIAEDDPVTQAGLALIAMRLKASEQLNGVPDQVNCIAESYLPMWDGAAWAWSRSRNPAWAYCDLLRRRAGDTAIEDSRIDLEALGDWADDCDAPAQDGNPTWRFDGGIEGEVGSAHV